MAYMHGCWAWSADVVVRWSAVVLMLERVARALSWGGTHALYYLVGVQGRLWCLGGSKGESAAAGMHGRACIGRDARARGTRVGSYIGVSNWAGEFGLYLRRLVGSLVIELLGWQRWRSIKLTERQTRGAQK